jgi:hypothetical protein
MLCQSVGGAREFTATVPVEYRGLH